MPDYPQRLRDHDTGDEYERVHSNIYRRTSTGGGGCFLGFLGLLVLAICGPIFYLGVSYNNYQKYHIFTYSETDAAAEAYATADAPYHFDGLAINAKTSGNTTNTGSQGIQLGDKGAITFTINEPEDGSYNLYIEGFTTGSEIINVTVNSKLAAKIDTSPESCRAGGPCDLPATEIIHLKNGSNTLELSVGDVTYYPNGTYGSILIKEVTIDKSSSTNATLSQPPSPLVTSGKNTEQVDVQANSDWQDTGVSISQGARVNIIYASGVWRPWPGVDFTAEGCTQGCDPTTNNLIVGCHHGGLIAKIGSQMICVLKGTTVKATDSGKLYLRINDQQTSDDSGAITVKITVTKS